MVTFPDNIVEVANKTRGGFNQALGLEFVSLTPDEIVGELEVADHHKQPYGLVHGGVYSAVIETLCSTGAALNVLGQGRTAVGLENTTSFIRAVRSGTLRGIATPLTKGRRSQVWEARITDARDRLVATGRVRLMVLEAGASAGGEKVGMVP